ncbi:Hypothetical predicted protein, partial [Paramuricea clavata]
DYAEVEVENSGGGEISQAGMAEVANFSNQTHKGQDNQKGSLSSVINSDRFSSLKKLILVTGYVLRFVNNLRKRVKRETNLITEDMITVTEYNEALIMWIKDEQFQLSNKIITQSSKHHYIYLKTRTAFFDYKVDSPMHRYNMKNSTRLFYRIDKAILFGW